MNELIDTSLFALVGLFFVATFSIRRLRIKSFSRSGGEWVLDLLSSVNHFLIIPLFQTAILYKAYAFLFSKYQGVLDLGPFLAIVLVMAIDYGWYWNHRFLHSRTKLWNFHMVHHGAESLDFMATFRNTFWSPLFMIYIWAFSLILFFAKDPQWFLAFSGITLMVNLWGHTSFNVKRGGGIDKFFSLFLITPHDHYWHHSSENSYCNFGTTFNFWDKIHGTWYSPKTLPSKLGFPVKMSYLRQAFFPFERR